MKLSGAISLALIIAAGFASCSQSISVPSSSLPNSAQDFFWQPTQLALGINYFVLRNGVGSDHLLSSIDGNHIEDGALNNEVTMIAHASMDSVLIDSMGANSIFNLPSGYNFGADSSSYITVKDSVIRDTMVVRDSIFVDKQDSLKLDTVSHDTTIPYWVHFDTSVRATGNLLLLLRTEMVSGGSWRAGVLFGPGIPNGMPVIATVLDHVDSLHIPPVSPGADSTFDESFRVRYAPENFSDSVGTFPIYWIAYFSRNIGPVLIQQYTLRLPGKYVVTDSVQIVEKAP